MKDYKKITAKAISEKLGELSEGVPGFQPYTAKTFLLFSLLLQVPFLFHGNGFCQISGLIRIEAL